MKWTVGIVFESGATQALNWEPLDLTDATEQAIRAADRLGHQTGDGDGPAVLVQVRGDDRIYLSLRVMKGGLREGTEPLGRLPRSP